MRKVIKRFFCIQEKKAYEVGSFYDGKRTDLEQYFEPLEKEQKTTRKTKELKTDKKTK